MENCQTNKSGKFTVCSRGAYLDMGQVHTTNDPIVTQEEISSIQRQLNGHVSMLSKAFGVGKAWEQSDRIRETTLNKSEEISNMYILNKDHKEIKEDQLPPIRPVVSGDSGMGRHLAGLLSDIVESLVTCLEGPFYVVSSEVLASKIDIYQEVQASQSPQTPAQKSPKSLGGLPLNPQIIPTPHPQLSHNK